MGLHDVATVAGISEACKYCDHDQCRAPGCSCSCHNAIPNLDIPSPNGHVEAGPENACPTCGTKRPAAESYCRIDGSKLTSLACGMCGRGMNPPDAYCFNCGAPKGTVGMVKTPQIVTVPAVDENEKGYEQQVLKGLQEELSVQTDTGTVREVVEKPGGVQGSFTLVSAPNPNKIRTPKPASSQGDAQSTSTSRPAARTIRLPVKPS